jgi:hypothetical protein
MSGYAATDVQARMALVNPLNHPDQVDLGQLAVNK